MTVLLAARDGVAAEVLSAKAGPADAPGVYSMHAVAVVDASPLAMRHVIARMCDYKDQLPYIAYCRIFKSEGRTAWSYGVVDAPVFDARDYVIASTIDEDLRPDGTGVYRSRWELSPDVGPRPREGALRLQVNQGRWELRGIDGGKRTEMRYFIRTAPGGVIPGWVAGYVARTTLPDYVRTLERLAQDEERKGKVMVPGANPWDGVNVAALDDPLPPLNQKKAATAGLFPPAPPPPPLPSPVPGDPR
ncbi:MAG: hypothetical protein AB2A00_39170 [Myxococcota bacterium]